ncbi:MAG: EF-hand domain-containing protein [bacterium]|nr:EF-hand domain-containing protein [bacterium]
MAKVNNNKPTAPKNTATKAPTAKQTQAGQAAPAAGGTQQKATRTAAAATPPADQTKTGGGQKADLDLRAFQRLDTNKDGKLTGSEIRKRQAGFDKNGDKVVTQEEFKMSRNGERAKATFDKGDRNKDGVLTGQEISARVKGADENGDGVVTRGELRRFQNRGPNAVSADARFKAFDQNGDGVLTGNEAANAKWAKGLDANTDGKITLDEFKEVRARQGLEAKFKEFDQDGDGFLAGKNIQADVLAAKDSDKDGRLSLDEWLGIKPPAASTEPEAATEPEASTEPAASPESATVEVPDAEATIEPPAQTPTVDQAPETPATPPASPQPPASPPSGSPESTTGSNSVQSSSTVAGGGGASPREAILGRFTSLLPEVSKLDFDASKTERTAALDAILSQLRTMSADAGRLGRADAGAVMGYINPLLENIEQMKAASDLLP